MRRKKIAIELDFKNGALSSSNINKVFGNVQKPSIFLSRYFSALLAQKILRQKRRNHCAFTCDFCTGRTVFFLRFWRKKIDY